VSITPVYAAKHRQLGSKSISVPHFQKTARKKSRQDARRRAEAEWGGIDASAIFGLKSEICARQANIRWIDTHLPKRLPVRDTSPEPGLQSLSHPGSVIVAANTGFSLSL